MILLAKEGIFPIVRDGKGYPLAASPNTGFRFAGTVQGEGKLAGIPSLFIRLAGCNLHCMWKKLGGKDLPCDTLSASYSTEGVYALQETEIADIVSLNASNIRHVVITGGEPLLQADALILLCRLIKEKGNFHITLETNGTLFSAPLADYADFYSLSPKLASSVSSCHPGDDLIRMNIPVLQSFIDMAKENPSKDMQLKFVFSSPEDETEIESVLSRLNGWETTDILLMPLGGDRRELERNARATLEVCIRHGWRFCDRLHLRLFSASEGV